LAIDVILLVLFVVARPKAVSAPAVAAEAPAE